MKSLVATVAALGVFAGLSTADDTCSSLTAVGELCPSCDGKNVTDAGSKWAVSCDYRTYGTGQQDVLGEITLEGCFDACDDAENCYGINIAANGSCSIVSGDQKALSSESGWTNLYRFPSPASSGSGTASSAVADPQITSTVFTGGLTQSASSAPPISITSTDSAASATPSCDLELDNLCPDCNGTVVSNNDGGDSYTIVCDVELDSSNGTYSVQDELSPAGCIHQCDTLPFCKGASYYDYRACEIAKGDLTSSSKSGYTAFVPVTSTSAPPTSSKVSISATTTDPTFSILPTSSGCDPNAITCPECNGIAVPDKLNASYTVLCGIQPVCDSEPIRNAISQDVCMQYCDQDVTCLAVKWYEQEKSCHLCQQGLDEGAYSDDLPYIVLVADLDGDNDPGLTSTTSKSAPATSITDFPAPFPTSTSVPASITGNIAVTSSVASAGLERPGVSFNPGGPIINITTPVSALPTSAVNVGSVSCPGYNKDIYIEPESGNYYQVLCDNIYSGAAHSRYVDAPDFAACVASCTGECDGVQFGYSKRCGLYTDISVVATSASGWTLGVSITIPTPNASTTSSLQLTSVSATATAAPAPPKYGNGTAS